MAFQGSLYFTFYVHCTHDTTHKAESGTAYFDWMEIGKEKGNN